MSPSTGAKVLGYIRVSTEDQAREGVSLDAQESRLRDYCRAREWELVDVIRDEGRSAKDLRRPGLQAILAALPKKQRGWGALIVVKLDRLTRSVKDLAGLTEAFQRAKVGFTSIAENVDTTSASGELFLNIIGALSQWERKAIGERTRAAMDHLRTTRRRIGSTPYGYRVEPTHVRRLKRNGKLEAARLIPDAAEQRVLTEILALHGRGLPLRAIAGTLAQRGLLARCGRPFAPQTLHRLVTQGALRDKDGRDSPLDSVAPGVLLILDERRRALLDDGSEDEP
jgi:site-specific DNA recombinase